MVIDLLAIGLWVSGDFPFLYVKAFLDFLYKKLVYRNGTIRPFYCGGETAIWKVRFVRCRLTPAVERQ